MLRLNDTYFAAYYLVGGVKHIRYAKFDTDIDVDIIWQSAWTLQKWCLSFFFLYVQKR